MILFSFFFILVYVVGVTVKMGAGAGELDSFSRLCSPNPHLAFRARAQRCSSHFIRLSDHICFLTSLDITAVALFDTGVVFPVSTEEPLLVSSTQRHLLTRFFLVKTIATGFSSSSHGSNTVTY